MRRPGRLNPHIGMLGHYFAGGNTRANMNGTRRVPDCDGDDLDASACIVAPEPILMRGATKAKVN